MPAQRFRGDPYQALDIAPTASDAQIKRRWRDLAREHHPDRAAGDGAEQARLTARMARINAAYDVLRDPLRRAAYDGSPQGRRARADAGANGYGFGFDADDPRAPRGGPPPPPPTRPVTARYDTSAGLRPRNTRTSTTTGYARGHVPRVRRGDAVEAELRASTPTGPVHTRRSARAQPLPTLAEARETMLNFGRFHGYTLGEVELLEPSYIDWVARTITRDRDLVIKARVIQADLDEREVERPSRAATPGFGTAAG